MNTSDMILIIISSILLLAATMIYFNAVLSKVNRHTENIEIYMQECFNELREQKDRQREAIYDFAEVFNREYDSPKICINTEDDTLRIEIFTDDDK